MNDPFNPLNADDVSPDLTPLIDAITSILIVVLLVAPAFDTRSIRVELAEVDTKQSVGPSESLTVEVDTDGTTRVDKAEVDLGEYLAGSLPADIDNATVFPDEHAPFGVVARAQQTLLDHGLAVVVATKETLE